MLIIKRITGILWIHHTCTTETDDTTSLPLPSVGLLEETTKDILQQVLPTVVYILTM